jgi:predicted secreted protein
MMRCSTLPLMLILLLISSGLLAEQNAPTYNRVTLNESAQQEIDNDLLVVVFFAQAEGQRAMEPADEVNRAMDWAISVARSHPGIKAQTLAYSTQPIYDKSTIRGWRVRQSLRLESSDSRLLGDLIGQLQAQLKLQSIGYELSDGQRRKYLGDLTALALQRFTERAEAIARSLGRGGFRIVRLNINDGRHSPAPVVRSMMMEAKADMAVAPARIEAGTQELTVSVNGEIELNAD